MTARRSLTLAIFAALSSVSAWGATITITPTTLPNGAISGAYNQPLTATGGTGTITWSVSAGALPPGISLTATAGAGESLAGTFTQAGSFTFTISATTATPDSGSRSYTINVIGITSPANLPGGTVGIAYSQTLTVAGDTPPDTWSLATSASPPPGLTLNSNGTITGTPTTVGTYTFAARATDNTDNSTTSSLTIAISQLSINPKSLPGGTVGNNYSQQLSTSPIVGGLTWSTTGNVPPGLAINSSTGLLSGQLTSATGSPFAFTVVATGASVAAQQGYTVAVSSCAGNAPLLDLSAFNPRASAGNPFSSTLAATCGIPPYTFTLVGASPLNGLSISAAGVVSGTPTIAGATNLLVNIRDSLGNAGGGSATVNVIGITTSSLPPGTIGSAYSQQLTAGGVVGGQTWTLTTAGSLPPGLSLNAAFGTITGVPTTNGSYPFTVTVTDGTGNAASSNLTIVIGSAGSLSITTTSPITPGVVNAAYSSTVTATGGTPPYTWSASGLPSGLTIAPFTGVISGTPTAIGTTSFTVTAIDSASPQNTATATLQLVVSACSGVCITTTSPIAPGVVGAAYSATLQAVGGTSPYTWTLASGSLPPGLTLNSTSGVISGTPTTANSYSFSITVSDAASPQHTATTAFTMAVSTGSSSFTITTTSPLPPGTVNVSYLRTLAATGGTAPYTWSATNLPAGLTLSSSGILSGTPTASGSSTITVTATDSSNPALTALASLGITIISPPLSITTTSLQPGPAGFPYTKTLQAAGGTTPYTWTLSSGSPSLPAGLTLSSTGVISGTPTTAGTTTFSVTVTDSSSPNSTAVANLTIVITNPTLTVTGVNASCFVATINRPFPDSQVTPPPSCPTNNIYQFTATGTQAPVPSYTFSVAVPSALPPGLTLSTGGVLSGIPTAAGTFTFVVVATDSLQAQGAVSATLVVGPTVQPTSVSITLGGSTASTIAANTQPPVVLSIGNTFPFPVNGKVTVSFVSSVGGLNTLVQFASGSTATFRILAGSQTAAVGPITTGTQAGTITLTATQFTDDFGNNLTPGTAATVSYTVAAGPPVITNVAVSNVTPTGFTLAITGFSTTRDMTSAAFTFTAPATDTLASATVTVPLTTQFTAWYNNPQSNAFGSTFVVTIPFTVSATSTVAKPVSGITVTMTNSKGTSPASTSINPYP